MSTGVTIQKLAQRFVGRAAETRMRGKKRDEASLEFFLGAAALAEAQGDEPLCQHILKISGWMISIRGFKAVEELAKGE